MKIKVAILDSDNNYLKKITNVFNQKYADKVEIHSFTNADIAIEQLASERINIMLIDENYMQAAKEVSKQYNPIIMTDTNGIDNVEGISAICKYQKVDSIYKKILAIYSDNSNYSISISGEKEKGNIVMYASVAGGVGTSTMAIGYAINRAKLGKRVLYLDFNTISNVSAFLSGEGQYTFSDVLFAVKSKKNNLSMKLVSTVKKDISGVEYFEETSNVLDMTEMSDDDAITIIKEIEMLGEYDYIIVDASFSLSKAFVTFMEKAQKIIIVSDGNVAANTKVVKTYEALKLYEGRTNIPYTNKIGVIYNRFSNKTGHTIENGELKNIGGVPKFQDAKEREVIEHISGLGFYNNIIEDM